ncbi:MAG: DNA methyltransferase, partial [Coleofasciculaceae cyanobacterium]
MITTNLSGIQIEGNLIAADLTSELAEGNFKGQAPEDFGLGKIKTADEIATAWGDAKAYWAAFQRRLGRLEEADLATSITREQWVMPLLESLGFVPVYTAKAEVVDGQTYAISHRAEEGENKPPLQIIGCRVKLDKRPPSGMPRLSAHALMQEYLNRTEHLWGIVTNGLKWRLLRDSSLMTRLSYIEFDLEQILNSENFAEFGLFYRLFHRSRLPQGMADADACLLEFYHQEAIAQGGRVRDKLRDGVELALVKLGTGFLQHRDNLQLRGQFESGELSDRIYYRQLLLLIYRLLFLMVAESRNLLLAGDDAEKARIYQEYYSISRLREVAEQPSYRREGFGDLWQSLRVTFCLFDENWRGRLLDLSPLNGDLFNSETLKDLNDCRLDNHDLLVALRHLSLYEQKAQLRKVNYGALDVEELGSVYESLLDFHPQVSVQDGIYQFDLVLGSERKTTGSYYTPPDLVGQLIKSALEPVIEAKLAENDLTPQSRAGTGAPPLRVKGEISSAEKALLSIKIVDPACGSGHFLLAAARRIGKELARIRTGETQPTPEPLRQAIRDVIQNCIYGVDLNPLAVDLCKVALWIEGFCRGLPLNFLDHRIKCGNSLVGVLDLSCLDEGIPDDAFKAVTGDDKALASRRKKENKKQRLTDLQGQLSIFNTLETERNQYAKSWQELGEIAETTTSEVKQKATQYQESRQNSGWWRDYSACNLYTAAFFMPLTEQNLQLLPTTAALNQLLRGNISTQKIVDAANKLAEEKFFFHWCLEFPNVFAVGGFDCVLGNPPWERIKLQEKEFFASRDVKIVKAVNKAAREKLIKLLPQNNPELAQDWEDAKHDADAQGKFIRESGRFPLTAVGDINTYAVFAETTR